jgi:hypothetical protein
MPKNRELFTPEERAFLDSQRASLKRDMIEAGLIDPLSGKLVRSLENQKPRMISQPHRLVSADERKVLQVESDNRE